MEFNLTSAVGWIAATLVLASFCCKTMASLRIAAICSNVAFMSYGFMVGATPIVVLHALLLPLNLWRLQQIFRLAWARRDDAPDLGTVTRLLAHLRLMKSASGEVLFHHGEPANKGRAASGIHAPLKEL
jgi:hypothetical protein